ncbi:hypothetical protein [Methyloglobulus sp.]|uniref:hypothetical protein n=1 Tax=Methyloglobulus sp. TaxID=2518622 RepID=UPI0032B7A9AE
MPLEHLVEYFNDRFRREHGSSYRPFILKDGIASGLFGPVRINSVFSPIRQTLNPTVITGHTAQIEVSNYGTQQFYENEIEYLLASDERQPTGIESIINFDRLSRTVHMLNFLTLLPSYGNLFLEVDPLHILGIKQDHGVYFGEVIAQCGLKTNNVVIELSVHNRYVRYYKQLFSGLENYQRQGYQIGLKFDYLVEDKAVLDLIAKLSPNYVSVPAKNIDQANENDLEHLDELKRVVASVNGKSILKQVDQKKSDTLARNVNFDLVEGCYYRAIAFDYVGRQQSVHRNSVTTSQL